LVGCPCQCVSASSALQSIGVPQPAAACH
jgi:hypothetical protein